MRKPSVKKIKELLEHYRLPPERAKEVRKALESATSHKKVDEALEVANKALEGHGVEALHANGRYVGYYMNIVALYVNMGDSYAPTVIYDTRSGSFSITDYATRVTTMERKGYKFG